MAALMNSSSAPRTNSPQVNRARAALRVALAASLLLLVAACGGGDELASSGAIGSAGGSVSEPSGAGVVVPPGALAGATPIAVAQSNAGAPPMPAGVTPVGPIYAFTPHGTTFAAPVTLTVPFDPAAVPAGATLALLKTNATQSAWEMVAGAAANGHALSGSVTGFSYAAVVTVPASQFALAEKSWKIETNRQVLDENQQVGQELIKLREVGTTLRVMPGGYAGDRAQVGVYSDATGRTFWALAVAPQSATSTASGPDEYYGNGELTQTFYFEAEQDHPSLNFVISHISFALMDYGGNAPGPRLCNWLAANASTTEINDDCVPWMSLAQVSFELNADSLVDQGTFFSTGGAASISGIHQNWRTAAVGTGGGQALWNDSYFQFDLDADHDGGGHYATGNLRQPRTLSVPVQHLKKGDVFMVTVTVRATAMNMIQGESFVGAFLRDPLQSVGLQIDSAGLKEIPARGDIPTGAQPITCSGGSNPAAGQLQWAVSKFSAPERARQATVHIERVNGTVGEVTVRVNTRDGTALAGADYQAVSSVVHFADGEGGQRIVLVPLVDDFVAESDEAATVELSGVGGCAQLGAQSTATLTIFDDDRPPSLQPTYTIGGTVTGLTGGGLVLRDILNGGSVDAGNGGFTLSGRVTDGLSYDVRIDAQPTGPTQQCSVANGAGSIASANVTNVQVTCTTPASGGALDGSFGSGGRVTTNIDFAPAISGAPVAMALQPDGRILLLGGLKLLRINADGTLDTSFGNGGQVTVPFNASVFDTAQDVAVQSDGRIVVVGFTNAGGANDDFALARFNADGSLDTSFGSGGKTSTDFLGSTDRARRVRIQPDGKIVVAGFATVAASPTQASVDFAGARYNPDGSLDASFGAGGKVRDSVAGTYDVAQGLALQSDGKIVLAGRAANDGVADPDIGIVRYWGEAGAGHLAGYRDETFGALNNGLLQSDLQLATGWEEANDVVVLANGTIAIAGRVPIGATVGGRNFQFILALCGSLACQAGQLTRFSDQSDSPRSMLLQSDGKIVVVGQSASYSSNPDMAIVRYAASGLAPDASFGTDGKLTLDFFGAIDSAEAVAQQADGKLVVGGYARFSGRTVFALARVLP